MSDTDGGNAGTNSGTGTDSAAGATGTNDGQVQAVDNAAATDAGKTFTQADLDKVVSDRLARERSKFADYDDLKTKAGKFDEIQDAQKTDLEKANDALATAQAELAVHRVTTIRRDAALEVGLPPELAEFITESDPAKALEQAKRLAERVKPPEPNAANFQQGARQTAKPNANVDDWIRSYGGR